MGGDPGFPTSPAVEAARLIDASGLPPAVQERVRAVLAEARLDGATHLDVARELLAHFADGADAGRPFEELLATFGDVALTGRLISRQTRRLVPRFSAPGSWRHSVAHLWSSFRLNLRYAARRLRGAPGFTATALLSLALGIGANTAIFSVVNALLIREVPFERPYELVEIYETNEEFAFNLFSYPDFEDLEQATTDVFVGVSATALNMARVDRGADVELIPIELVTGNYFPLLGIEPAVGRTLLPEDHVAAGAHPVVMLGHGYWLRAFGGDPAIVGSEIRMSGRSYEIVGVAPAEFPGTFRGIVPDLFAPMLMWAELSPDGDSPLDQRGNHSLFVKGRLRSNRPLAAAETSVATLADALIDRGDWEAGDAIRLVPTEDVVLFPPLDRFVRGGAWLLMGVVALVLLIACVNLAGYLLARAADRRKEIALRLALGATRRTLIEQLLVETTLLGVLGGVAGVGLAVVMLRALLAADLPLPLPVTLDLSLDRAVLGYSVLISLVAGVLCGLAPALQATRPDVAATLKDGGSNGGRQRGALRNGLVVVQVSVSLVLLVGAGLFLRSMHAIQTVDPGFGTAPSAILTVGLPAKYSDLAGMAFYDQLRERYRQIPGVVEVGMISNLHLNTLSQNSLRINVDGVAPPPDREGFDIDWARVDGSFFDAAGVALREGRTFLPSDDADGPAVAIVSEALARRFWPEGSALGQTMRSSDSTQFRIVGITADTKVRSLGESPRPFIYRPVRQDFEPFLTVVARTGTDPERVAAEMLAAARNLDPELWLWDPKSMDRHLGIVLLPARLSALVMTVFALLALGLAAVGLYGIVSYAVAQRTREVGIRISLGASAEGMVRLLMAGGLRVVALGAGLGLVASIGIARLLSGFLFGIGAWDVATFVGVPLLLGGVAAVAAYLPARRASRVDPVTVLRAE